MNPRKREAVAAALYALVNQAAGTVLNLRTSGRRLRHFQEMDGSQLPALFMVQKPETQERQGQGLPAKRTMWFEVWLYTVDPQADSPVPAQQLNNMVDAIEEALEPTNRVSGVNNLRLQTGVGTQDVGLVTQARIDGSVEYYESVTNDGKSIAIVPIAVVLP